MDIPILFEDAEALVVDKPGGLPMDRPRAGGPSLVDHLDELRLGFQRRPVPVHRLDADTSGCLLLARNPKALKRFASAFEMRQVSKRYLGIMPGRSYRFGDRDRGVIDLPLKKVSTAETGWRMIADWKGKQALTAFRLVKEHDGMCLIEFIPETGRTHQIRVHALSGLGMPLLGDPVYGDGKGASRTMLHASSILVPRGKKPDIAATAPLPADFAALGFADG